MDVLAELLNPSRHLEITLLRWSKLGIHWHLDQRRIEENLVYWLESGEIELTSQNRTVTFGAGSFMWIPANLEHGLRQTATSDPIELFHMRFVTNRKPIHDSFVVEPDRWDLREPFSRLLSEFRLGLAPQPLRLRAQLFLLLESAFSPQRPQLGQFSTQQVEVLRSVVEQSPDLRLGAAELAEALGLNQDYFARIFKRTFQESPRRWLVRQRVQRIAEELQTSSQSLTELAQQHGYPDVYSFGKQFRKFMGTSPGKYRDTHSHTKDHYP